MSNYSYLILGSGKQGIAAAYDILLHGDAARLTLADHSLSFAEAGTLRLKKLLGPIIRKNRIQLSFHRIEARDKKSLKNVIQGHDAVLSALPYYLNPLAAESAIAVKSHYCDLGGYFEITKKIFRINSNAKNAGVTLIPDCGVSPGMCNSLAICAMDQLDETSDVHIYCGGLPQKPRPPLGYKVVFNLEGVLGNYFGKSYVLRGGKIKLVPSFSGREEINFGNGIGKLEAVVTGGATSTCPWTFKWKLKNYDYKTLRYPGHYEKIQLLKDLGLLETAPVQVNGFRVAPRDLFVTVAEPRLRFPDDRDLLIMRVLVTGRKSGAKTEITYDVFDRFDSKTGFTAMQRTTGFSAAIVLEMLAKGVIRQRGVVPVERAVPGSVFLQEIRKRGIEVKETVRKVGRKGARA